MEDPQRLTPAEARARFGELLGPAKTHRHFDTPEGLWRPEFDERMKLACYRLHPTSGPPPAKVLFRHKRRR